MVSIFFFLLCYINIITSNPLDEKTQSNVSIAQFNNKQIITSYDNRGDSQCINHILYENNINTNVVNEHFYSQKRKEPHSYPIYYENYDKHQEIIEQFINETNKKSFLKNQIYNINQEKDKNKKLHQIILASNLLFYYDDDKSIFMKQILSSFNSSCIAIPSSLNENDWRKEEKFFQTYLFALFSILNNPDSFQTKSNENENLYDQLFDTQTVLFNKTINVTLQNETNTLILAIMTIYIDLFPYEEKNNLSKNNENNPLNNIAKTKTEYLISHIPKFATKKFQTKSEDALHEFEHDNFIFNAYHLNESDNSIEYTHIVNYTNHNINMAIRFNPRDLLNELKSTGIDIIAVYAYPYYPKISIMTKDYNHSFVGIKGYDKDYEEQSVNFISHSNRPEILIRVNNYLNNPEKFCYFFNEEDFNPFSNLGIQSKRIIVDNILELNCSISMLRDFTYGDRQVMRLIWIGVLAGISLLILIILFVLFMRFKVNIKENQENAFMSSRLSNPF